MREPEMRQVAAWIAAVIDHIDDDDTIARVRSEVQDVCRQRPVPGIDVA
jgi:glycine/serine hydroxymethyltransferase